MSCVGSCVTQWPEGQHDVFWASVRLINVMCTHLLGLVLLRNVFIQNNDDVSKVFFFLYRHLNVFFLCLLLCVQSSCSRVTAVPTTFKGSVLIFIFFNLLLQRIFTAV